MAKSRIYVVETVAAPKTRRLIRAASAAEAFRHVANDIISAGLASQDELIASVQAGVTVEDAAAEPETKKAAE